MINIDEKDNGKTFSITRDEKLRITLSENPSTGFMWLEQIVTLNEVLELETDESCGSNFSIGGSCAHIWIFAPTRPGERKIRFLYQRPWENSDTAEKKFEITVQVLEPDFN